MSTGTLTDLPQPKFRIGDTIYCPGVTEHYEELPCPDCLGERKWKITFPNSMETTTACLRCASNYYRNSLPRMTKYAPYVSSMTVGSIRIDTAEPLYDNSRSAVSYMCTETGVGSGSIYYENNIFATHEEAMHKGAIMAAERQTKLAAQPSVQELLKSATLPIEHVDLEEERTLRRNYSHAMDRFFDKLFSGVSYRLSAEHKQAFLDYISRTVRGTKHEDITRLATDNANSWDVSLDLEPQEFD